MPPRALWLMLSVSIGLGVGCTAVEPVPSKRQPEEGQLELEVEPESAEIYVDGEFRGKAAGWKGGLVPMEPGEHRVKIAADGYMSRRFDVAVEAGERVTLTVELEEEFDDFSEQ